MPASRVAPPAESWEQGKAPFLKVLATVRSDVVIAFSKRLARILKPLCADVSLATRCTPIQPARSSARVHSAA